MTNNCNTYSLEEYMKPYWNSKVIYNESIMPLESSVGHMKPISLMYDIAQILSVKSASLENFYEEGKDYVLEEGKLKILSSGDIRTIKYRFMYPLACDNSVLPDRRHGYMFFSEGSKFHNMQLAVTYIPKGNWEGETPTSKGFLLPKTMRKLRVGEELKIILYGDSISVGANSTKFVNTPPYCANYIEMLVESLKNKYHSDISFENLSSGGKDSYWGAENINRLIADKNPNLVIIAFGMNDGIKGMSGVIFKRNIEKIINTISQKNSTCEYILVTSMLPNEDWSSTTKQTEYRVTLNELEREGCAIADVTSIHEYLLSRKRYIDMTGNHVNHPNDFLVRLYAQVIYELFQ